MTEESPDGSSANDAAHAAHSEPWYADGLAFACTGCGNCCTGAPGYVWVTDEEIAAIAAFREQPVSHVRLQATRPARGKTTLRDRFNGDCVYLDAETRRCTIYPVRPKQCRTWPFWPETLRSPQTWAAAARGCPGIGRGDFVPLEQITATARDAGLPFQSLASPSPKTAELPETAESHKTAESPRQPEPRAT